MDRVPVCGSGDFISQGDPLGRTADTWSFISQAATITRLPLQVSYLPLPVPHPLPGVCQVEMAMIMAYEFSRDQRSSDNS
jgi:hypothetical protein